MSIRLNCRSSNSGNCYQKKKIVNKLKVHTKSCLLEQIQTHLIPGSRWDSTEILRTLKWLISCVYSRAQQPKTSSTTRPSKRWRKMRKTMSPSTNTYIRMGHASIVNRKVKLKSTQTRMCSFEWEVPVIHLLTRTHPGCRCNIHFFLFTKISIVLFRSVAAANSIYTFPPEAYKVHHFVF